MNKQKNGKKKAVKKEEKSGVDILRNGIINPIIGLILFSIAVYIIIAFISYFSSAEADQSLVEELRNGEILNESREFQNSCGSLGALVSHFFIADCFGFSAFLIPVFIALLGLRMLKAYKVGLLKWFLSLSVVMIWCSVALAKFVAPFMEDFIFNPGGGHGAFCCSFLEGVIGTPGLIAVLTITAIMFLTYLSQETINVVRRVLNPTQMIRKRVKFVINSTADEDKEDMESETVEDPEVFDDPTSQVVEFSVEKDKTAKEAKEAEQTEEVLDDEEVTDETEVTLDVSETQEEDKADAKTVESETDLSTPINPREPFTSYKFPTLDLLKKYESDGKPYIDMKEQTANKNRIVEVLNNFGVEVRTITATVGPTITLYEITLGDGIRVSKIKHLEDDIALSLAALGIRIIAPIPGKGTIGIEVPNAKPNIVSMESILNSKKFQETKMDLPIAIGKTITNEVFMVDLAKIPHLLVAGATGQGKSVGLNAIITSLLYKKHPNEIKFVLIDPKKVEFSIYAPITNHFLAKVPDNDEEPIITDVTKVIRTLNSICALMDHRYDMLKNARARNIKEYNDKFVHHQLNLTEGHEYMPYIVVVIDEYGDLIMTAGREIELPITRIAQLARAVGIHMVIATQRPTAKIITGNIKANFPGRMAFRVGSRTDSSIILDRSGANQLIGRGDLLFLNGSDPVRVQCAFVDTPEVERINNYVAKQVGPVEPMELPEPPSDGADGGVTGGSADIDSLDPLIGETAKVVIATNQGSTSMIQRRFSIGYNRAGRIMDQLEKLGIVGVAQGGKPREVFIQDENSLRELLKSKGITI